MGRKVNTKALIGSSSVWSGRSASA